jgi:hypothetical protein
MPAPPRETKETEVEGLTNWRIEELPHDPVDGFRFAVFADADGAEGIRVVDWLSEHTARRIAADPTLLGTDKKYSNDAKAAVAKAVAATEPSNPHPHQDSNMETINEKSPDARAYIAGLNDRKIGLYASSLYAGKQLAIRYFKPNKKNMGLLWISVAYEEG